MDELRRNGLQVNLLITRLEQNERQMQIIGASIDRLEMRIETTEENIEIREIKALTYEAMNKIDRQIEANSYGQQSIETRINEMKNEMSTWRSEMDEMNRSSGTELNNKFNSLNEIMREYFGRTDLKLAEIEARCNEIIESGGMINDSVKNDISELRNRLGMIKDEIEKVGRTVGIEAGRLNQKMDGAGVKLDQVIKAQEESRKEAIVTANIIDQNAAGRGEVISTKLDNVREESRNG
jgi:hypothetical protein